MLKVCYFATNMSLIRNEFLKNALTKNEVHVVEIKIPQRRGHKFTWLIKSFFLLLFSALKTDFYIFLIGMGSYLFVFLGKMICIIKRKPLVFDIFVSLYDTKVHDRKLIKQGTRKAHLLRFFDKYTCLVSDIVLLDTNVHIDYFKKEYGLSNTNFKRVLIGSIPNKNMHEKYGDEFTILFFGNFIPLQGVEYIVEAAKELEGRCIFNMIGDGQTYNECVNLSEALSVSNIHFMGRKSYKETMHAMSQSDLGLGIFGNTSKAKRVIPHKAYEVIASQKPLLSGDSEALRELFTPGKDCLTCKIADGESLANVIKNIIDNPERLKKISQEGYKTYSKYCTPEAIGADLKKSLLNLLTN